jgi:hypothetical protein
MELFIYLVGCILHVYFLIYGTQTGTDICVWYTDRDRYLLIEFFVYILGQDSQIVSNPNSI